MNINSVRILIHGINFSPELTGIGKYSGEMVEWLASRGHEVRVVTAPPYYPQWKVLEKYSNFWGRESLDVEQKRLHPSPLNLKDQNLPHPSPLPEGEGINSYLVYRCPLWVPAKPSGLKRLLHLASFALSSFPIMLRQIFWRPDVVIVIEPPLFCAPQSWLVARLTGGNAWLHVQDYEVDAAFSLGLLKGAILRGLVMKCERWLMRRFDRVSTISQRMVDLALAKGVAPEKLVMFRNWVEINQVQSNGDEYRVELGIQSDAIVALYSGNMGGKQGLEILAQAASLLRDVGNVVFVICGNGAGRADLVELCTALTNVIFIDLQPPERLSDFLSMADIHLLPQRADAADLVMPSKLTGMLASARPVLATANIGTELATVVQSCGLVVPPEQPQAFAEAILKLATDADLREKLGSAGRVYAETYLERDSVLGGLEAELTSLLGAK
jgi:colanic acid biosynthesis glycosyl transferase WcaI